MKRFVSFAVAGLFATATLSVASVASAKPFPMLHKLVKKGAIEKADLDGLMAAAKEAKTCHQAHKAGTVKNCLAPHIAVLKAQIAAFEKAIPKIEKKGWIKKATKVLKKLQKRLAKKEAAAAAPAADASGSGSAAAPASASGSN